jgi:hypothetical protein
LVVKGRLHTGFTQKSAQAELATIGAALEREYPKTNRNRHPAPGGSSPFVLGVQLDWRVVGFSLLVALASCLFFGLAPAWQTVRIDFANALKADGHGTAGPWRTLGRDVLVVGQIAMTMVVRIAAGMFFAGFRKMLASTPGIPDRPSDQHAYCAGLAPLLARTDEGLLPAACRLRSHVTGCVRRAMTESLPLSPSQTTVTVVPEGYQFPKGREKTVEFGAAVDSGYFRTMRVEITRGRAFTDDDRAGSRRVAIVNQQFAKTYWPGQDPIGKRVRLDRASGAAEVVGVAKTRHYLIVNQPLAPYVYLRYEQNPRSQMTLIVQSVGDPANLAAPVRDLVRSIDANLPVFNLRTVCDALRKPRHRYVVAVLPDGGDDGIHRLGARNNRPLWACRLHSQPARQRIRYSLRARREPSRRCVAGRAPRADSCWHGYRNRRWAHRLGSSHALREFSGTRRIAACRVRFRSHGVTDDKFGNKLPAGTASREAGSVRALRNE